MSPLTMWSTRPRTPVLFPKDKRVPREGGDMHGGD